MTWGAKWPSTPVPMSQDPSREVTSYWFLVGPFGDLPVGASWVCVCMYDPRPRPHRGSQAVHTVLGEEG